MAHSLAKLYQRHHRLEGGIEEAAGSNWYDKFRDKPTAEQGCLPPAGIQGSPVVWQSRQTPAGLLCHCMVCIVWVTAGGPAQEKQEKACEESNSLSRYPCGCLYWSVTVWRHFISSYFRILTLKWNIFFPTWHFQAGFLPHSPMTAAAISWGWRTWRWVP